MQWCAATRVLNPLAAEDRQPISQLAEREGFEPSVEFPLHTLSKRAPSTTRTSLRIWNQRLASGRTEIIAHAVDTRGPVLIACGTALYAALELTPGAGGSSGSARTPPAATVDCAALLEQLDATHV